ncbi:hypothetical protein E0Z10_g3469 [Xylaria hypoxylon]|uniref:Heterokaryon incompatibility domain-containing protein n=1 Tax=Xylaria hypoxylon TaxID=37992 RepID=A0A4Z0YN43_9PEZI|nr:hypothetical protein E0Z10_g3469 [Xylaria hypoxylon]
MDTPSIFCDKCQAIQFNDAEWGGYAVRNEEGKTILKFDEDDRPRRFKIQLDIEDIYPRFPFLSKLAAEGCDCCGMLKHSALKAFEDNGYDDSREEKFRISVDYLWNQRAEFTKRCSSLGLHWLVINFEVLKDEATCQEWLNIPAIKPGKIMTPETISWLQSHLNSCRQCDNRSHGGLIPTRLVQVDCNPPRLVEMNPSTILALGLNSVKTWYTSIVTEYSDRLLTYPTDRLPAISGVAKLLNDSLCDEYVAGLWRRQLHQGLDWKCWRIGTKHLSWLRLFKDLTDTATYVAPSWSWASRVCYIEFGLRFSNKQRGRMEYGSTTPHISLAGTNPYGQLSNALLRVTTKVVRVPTDITFDDFHSEGCVYVGSYSQPYARCSVDWGLGPDGEHLRSVYPDGLMLMLLAGVPYKHPSPSLSPISLTAELATLSEEESEEEEGSEEEIDEGLAYGLIIYQVPDTDNFLRVGVFESRGSDGWEL